MLAGQTLCGLSYLLPSPRTLLPQALEPSVTGFLGLCLCPPVFSVPRTQKDDKEIMDPVLPPGGQMRDKM